MEKDSPLAQRIEKVFSKEQRDFKIGGRKRDQRGSDIDPYGSFLPTAKLHAPQVLAETNTAAAPPAITSKAMNRTSPIDVKEKARSRGKVSGSTTVVGDARNSDADKGINIMKPKNIKSIILRIGKNACRDDQREDKPDYTTLGHDAGSQTQDSSPELSPLAMTKVAKSLLPTKYSRLISPFHERPVPPIAVLSSAHKATIEPKDGLEKSDSIFQSTSYEGKKKKQNLKRKATVKMPEPSKHQLREKNLKFIQEKSDDALRNLELETPKKYELMEIDAHKSVSLNKSNKRQDARLSRETTELSVSGSDPSQQQSRKKSGVPEKPVRGNKRKSKE